jgi:hypothetical protein
MLQFNGSTYRQVLRVDINGKMGINNNTPTEMLDVGGNIKATGITASLLGNASTATTATTATTANAVSFNNGLTTTAQVSFTGITGSLKGNASTSTTATTATTADTVSFNNGLTSAAQVTFAGITGSLKGSASYAPVEPAYSASISSIKQNTLTNTLYNITSAYTNTASYIDAAGITTGYINGDRFNKGIFYYLTASAGLYCVSAQQATNALQLGGFAASQWQRVITTGSSYPITSAYATTATTALNTNCAGAVDNNLVKFSSGNLLNSQVTDDGTNVGISKTAGTKLDVGGAIQADNYGRFKGWANGGSGLGAEIGISGGEGYLIGYNRSTSTYSPFNIGSNSSNIYLGTNLIALEAGFVGIGTRTTSLPLTVYGDAQFGAAGTDISLLGKGGTSWTYHFNNKVGNYLTIQSEWGSSTPVCIYYTGDVGIGTTTPAYKLEVSGNIKAHTGFYGNLIGNADTATTAAFVAPANIGSNYSASVSSQIGTKQNTLTNTTYVITASYALAGPSSGATAYTGTTSWTVVSLAQNYITSTTITVNGAALGDPVSVGHTGIYGQGTLMMWGVVSSTNTVTMWVMNLGVDAIGFTGTAKATIVK